MSTVFRNARLVLPDEVVEGSLHEKEGRNAAIGSDVQPGSALGT